MIKSLLCIKRDLNLKILAVFVTAMAILFMPFTVSADFVDETKLLASDGWANSYFGGSVSISGNTAIVGVSSRYTNGAYVYVRDAVGVWAEQQKLTASDSASNDFFGSSVSISGDTAIVGAYGDDDNGYNSGSAYVFVRDAAGVWTEQQKLKATDSATGDYFSYAVSISSDTVIIGAYQDVDNGNRTGSAYIFVRDAAGVWTEQQKLIASDGAFGDAFGKSVSISGDTVVIGAPWDDDNGDKSGSAYVFARDTIGVWAEQQKFTYYAGRAGNNFGNAVSISGDKAIVGAYRVDYGGLDSVGTAYVLARNPTTGQWFRQAILRPVDGTTNGRFGTSVSISGDVAIVGAMGDDDRGAFSGSAYIFMPTANNYWAMRQKLRASDGATDDWYGGSVSISGDSIIVGASGNDDLGDISGSAYVYTHNLADIGTELSVRAIEVTQAVQDWNNSVTLIEGKTTVVRAFVELLPGEMPRAISARLHGKRGSQALPGSPLFPVNGTVTIGSATFSLINIDTNIESRRDNLQDSFNFRLPTDWTSGDVDLELLLYDNAGQLILADCNEPGGTAPDCTVSVGFQPSEELPIRIYGFSWKDINDEVQMPGWRGMEEQRARIASVFPLARLDTKFWVTPTYDFKPALDNNVNSDLKILRAAHLTSCPTCDQNIRYYGVLVGNGIGQAIGEVASGYVTLGEERRDGTGYDRNRSGHEFAHTLGISHTVDPNKTPDADGTQYGSCGSPSSDTAAKFPNHDLINNRRVPVIGPLDEGVDSQIWGFDTRYLQDNVNDLAVIDPRRTPAMLSYCSGGKQARWVSAFNYERLITAITNLPPASAVSGADGTYLFVSGIMNADGSTVQNRPVIEVSGSPPLPTSGAYRVALNDAMGIELAAIDFEPVAGEILDATGPGGAVSGNRQQQLFFTVPLLKPATPIAEIIVSNNGVEISRVVASPNSPTVVITQPTVGQNLTTDTVTLAWQGSDADGDALTYTVQYSPDGGTSWSSLAVNTPIESYELERAYLSASTDARIRIAVSDGVNTSVATSDAFSVANSGPLVLIKQPRAGLSFGDGQTVIFEAFTYDTEDGSIADTSITWSSDIDGALGTGRELILNTLTTGLHTITVTATDSAGTPSSESTVLGIGVPLPDITVIDAITPANDQQIPFADLTVGDSSDQTVTVSNDGNADLVIGDIAQSDALTAPFSVVNDVCSGQTMAAAASCTFDVRFAPTTAGRFNNSLDIPSNDPDENSVAVSVSGTGLAIVNIPPSSPVLVSPTNGQQGLATSVTLEWQPDSDPDGDTVSYDIYNCTDSDPVNNCTRQAQVASLNEDLDNGFKLASLGLGGGIMILGITFVGSTRSRRKTALLVATIVLTSLLVSCGGGGGGGDTVDNDNKTYTVSGLATASTYYWVIVAKDGNGGETPSAVWSYSTQ